MGFLSAIEKVGLSVAVGVMTISLQSAAQTNYDPEYDDETAAGRIETAAEPSAASESEAGAETTSESSGEVSGEPAFDSEGEDAQSFETEADSAESRLNASGDLPPWAWGGPRHFNSLTGPVGLFNMYDAGSGDPGTFAVGIHGAFFKYTDYLLYGDEHVSMWGGLNLSVTPIPYLEIFAGLEASSSSNTMADPQLIQTLGEFNIGIKGMYSPIEMLSLGLIFGLEFQNPVGEVGVSFDGLTYPLGLLTSVDISKVNRKVPLKVHFNAVYRFDNSGKLVDEVEANRGGCGTDVNGDGVPDYGGCLDAMERKGLDIDRTDQMRLALGVEAAFPYVTPLIEWGIDIPVNRQDFVCPLPPTPSRPDSCMKQEGGAGMRQFLSLGVRILPPLRTLSIDLGVDIGLTGYAPTVHELAPQAPYRFLFGVTYSFDPFSSALPEKTAADPCPSDLAPEPILPQPVIAGYVHDSTDPNLPVKGAAVEYLGLDLNGQLSGGDGKFDSYPMPTGRVTVVVRADGYEDASFDVEIPDPAVAVDALGMPPEGEAVPTVVSLDCPLVKKMETGAATIVVRDDNGPIDGALVEVSGPVSLSGTTAATGEIRLEGEPGQYAVRVSKSGYFDRERVVEIAVNGESRLEVKLTPVPAESSVELSNERISIKKRVMFTSGSEQIEPESHPLLDEVVALLKQHPEITKLEVQGHTDNRGSRAGNLSLSSRRAEAVVSYLISEGIRADRLTAKGFGSQKPRAPNFTSSGRAKNRRVEFHIRERAQ